MNYKKTYKDQYFSGDFVLLKDKEEIFQLLIRETMFTLSARSDAEKDPITAKAEQLANRIVEIYESGLYYVRVKIDGKIISIDADMIERKIEPSECVNQAIEEILNA